jgi:hypothetical protein
MTARFKNNAFSLLASGITDVATLLTVTSSEGALFPNPVAPDYFYATLIDTSNNLEIVKCTARATDVLTIVRAQEGTSNIAYSTGDRIELRMTAAGLDELGGWTKGADVASASALPVLTDGNYFDVTGTTDITSINSMSVTPGVQIKLHFDSSLIITHHATNLIMPNGVSLEVFAGDEVEFVEYASGDYRCTGYVQAEETRVNVIGSTGGGTQDIDLRLGRAVSATVDTSTNTFTFSNPYPTGQEDGFTLYLTNGGSQTVNWPASVDWASATAPTLTTSGVDVLVFTTVDGGTIWNGAMAILASS